jgi:hypothetical protein
MKRLSTSIVVCGLGAILLSAAVARAGFVPPGPEIDLPASPDDDPNDLQQWSPLCPRTIDETSCTQRILDGVCTPEELAWLHDDCEAFFLALQDEVTADWDTDDILGVDVQSVELGPVLHAPVEHLSFDGFHSSYARRQLMARATCADLDAEQQRELDRVHWESNCATTSCEEYIFDKYYDYEIFEDLIAPLGEDHRAIFNAAYGAEGIANKVLRSVSGPSIPPITFGGRREGRNTYLGFDVTAEPVDWAEVARRNGFAGVQDLSNVTNLDGCSFRRFRNQYVCGSTADQFAKFVGDIINERLQPYDGARQTTIFNERTPTPAPGVSWWDFHADSSTSLAGYSDALLLWLDGRQREFKILQDRRLSTRQAINEALTWMDAIETGSTLPDAEKAQFMAGLLEWLQTEVAALKELDAELIAELDFAEGQGCLDVSGQPTPCDWSPRWLASAMMDQFLIQREDDYQRCLLFTGNNFNRLITPDGDAQHWLEEAMEDALVRGEDFCEDDDGRRISNCVIDDDYVSAWTKVEVYFATVEAWFKSLDVIRDPETGQPILGQTASDSGAQGDSLFGVSFDYSFGWQANELHEPGCMIGLKGHGSTTLDATVFGFDTAPNGHLFETDSAVDVGSREMSAHRRLVVLGEHIYTPVSPTGSSQEPNTSVFHFVDSEGVDEEVSHRRTFYLGWVPVTFTGALAGTLGTEVELEGSLLRCGMLGNDHLVSRSDFAMRPFANAKAFVSAVAGVRGASIGVRADITIFDLGLPFRSTGRLVLEDDLLETNAELQFTSTLLSGHVDLVAEVAWKTYKQRLFGWDGITEDNTLMRSPNKYPLDVLLPLLAGEPTVNTDATPLEVDRGGQCLTPVTLDDPTLYLSLDNSSVDLGARTVTDEINGYVFDYLGGASPDAAGVFGEAFRLDGTDGRLMAQSAGQPPNGVFGTYALWLKPDLTGGGLLQRGTAPEALQLFLRGTRRDVVLSANCGGTAEEIVTGLPDVNDPNHPGRDGYVHLTVVKVGGRLELFANGEFRGRWRCSNLQLSDDTLRYGELADIIGGYSRFGAELDEIVYYDGVALTAEQVKELYARGAEGRPAFGDGAQRPMGVTGLSADAGHGEVALQWHNPLDLGQANGTTDVSVRVDVDSPPQTLDDGTEVYRGSGTVATHSDATNGTTYHYAAFSHRADGSFLRGPTASATPTANPVPQVSGVNIKPGALQIELTWTNPDHLRFSRVVIKRKAAQAPTSSRDGKVAYVGDGSKHIDRELVAGTVYHYALYAQDNTGNTSDPVYVSGTPTPAVVPDTTPPLPVEDLSAVAADGTVFLSWLNPADDDLDHVIIDRLDMATLDPQWFETTASDFTDDTVLHGRSYRYAVVAVDAAGNESSARQVTVTAVNLSSLQPVPVFRATAASGQVNLSWTLPPVGSSDGVRIVRSTLRPPQAPDSGTLIYDGASSSHQDADVVDGATYYYSAFAYLTGPYYAAPTSSSVVVEDQNVTPPPPVRNLVGKAGFNSAVLSWELPIVGDLMRVELHASDEPFTAPDPLTRVLSGLDTSYVDEIREPTHYGVFAYDTANNVSTGAFVRVAPIIPPLRVAADAGPDQMVRGGDVVTLSAAGSVALDGQPLTSFVWRQLDGPTAALMGPNARTTHFVAPPAGGLLSFEVEVDDGMRADTDVVYVDVAPFVAPRLSSEQNPFATVVGAGRATRGLAADENGHVIHTFQDLVSSVWTHAVYDATTLQPVAHNLRLGDYGLDGVSLNVLGDILYPTLGVINLKMVNIADITAVTPLPPYNTPEPDLYNVQMNPRLALVWDTLTLGVFSVSDIDGLTYQADIPRTDPGMGQLRKWALSPVNDLAYVTYYDGTCTLAVCDLTTPTSPSCVPVPGLPLPGNCFVYATAVSDTLLLIAQPLGVDVYDISTPAAPVFMTGLPGMRKQITEAMRLSGDTLVWQGKEGVVQLWDLSVPSTPNLLPATFPVRPVTGSYTVGFGEHGPPVLVPPTNPTHLWVTQRQKGGVLADDGGVRVFDLASVGMAPPYPSAVAFRSPFGFKVDGMRAAVATEQGLSVVDLNDMTEQTFLPRDDLLIAGTTPTFSGVETVGDTAFVVGGTLLNTLLAIDISGVSTPVLVSETTLAGNRCSGMVVQGSELWLACSGGVRHRFDVSEPSAPQELPYLPPQGWPHFSPPLWALQGEAARYITVEAARGVMVQSYDAAGAANLSEASYSLAVTPDGPRQPTILGASHLLVANGIHGLQKIDLDSLSLGAAHVEASVSADLVYPLTFVHLDPGVPSGVVCEVSGGSCVIENLTPQGQGMAATLTWTLPATEGDHELMVVVGNEQYFVTARDRVRVVP